jgi:hypothetical protein
MGVFLFGAYMFCVNTPLICHFRYPIHLPVYVKSVQWVVILGSNIRPIQNRNWYFWYILWSFGIYLNRFGKLYQEKSGVPGKHYLLYIATWRSFCQQLWIFQGSWTPSSVSGKHNRRSKLLCAETLHVAPSCEQVGIVFQQLSFRQIFCRFRSQLK